MEVVEAPPPVVVATERMESACDNETAAVWREGVVEVELFFSFVPASEELVRT